MPVSRALAGCQMAGGSIRFNGAEYLCNLVVIWSALLRWGMQPNYKREHCLITPDTQANCRASAAHPEMDIKVFVQGVKKVTPHGKVRDGARRRADDPRRSACSTRHSPCGRATEQTGCNAHRMACRRYWQAHKRLSISRMRIASSLSALRLHCDGLRCRPMRRRAHP
jgi:hypothetical protein